MFIARDRFGIKPIYYTIFSNVLLISSEIKGLLAHSKVSAELDLDGVSELIGLGPAHEGGSGILKNIYEIKPAHCAIFNKDGFHEHKYWELENRKHNDTLTATIEKTRELIINAINNQLDLKEDACFFLSGGVDSSSIIAVAAEKLKKIKTYSIEYEGNEEHFKPSDFQPVEDCKNTKLIVDKFDTDHTIVKITTEDLIDNLEEVAIIRDQPGMGDIDSSLLFVCRKISEKYNIAFSGECGDEVFGGYPWFHRKEKEDQKIFPWARNLEFRHDLISEKFLKLVDISSYIKGKYEKSKFSVPPSLFESDEERSLREMNSVTLDWFMYTLGERSERIGMSQMLEIRMPYCDHKLVEYAFNIPWRFKAYDKREKGIMRKALEDIVPKDVVWNKKSPFPKTHNPKFEEAVKEKVIKILKDPDSLVSSLVNTEFLLGLTEKKSDYARPWFGQLMAEPQLYAYIIQMEAWLRHYKVKVDV